MLAATRNPQSDLRQRFLAAKREQKLRNRDAAVAIGVSEGEALAACVGAEAIRLQPNFVEIFEEVPQLGAVMALTRNDNVVHEKDGVYEKMSHNGHVGLALGAAIDLRIFYKQWHFGCAVIEEVTRGSETSLQKSLQFYDLHGEAVHKVFLREHSNHAAFDELVVRWRDPQQLPGITVEPAPPAAIDKADAEIDGDGFRAAWSNMQDTHEFFGLLRDFGVSRTQALRLAPPQFVRRLDNGAARLILDQAAASGLPIMVFVGNRGMIQIHSGPVANIKLMGPWLNVLDPGFNLHLREDKIVSSWVVSKPTRDGAVTSLELFDADGGTIAMLFGVRKPGQPELPAWRATAINLPLLQSETEVQA
ncbi:hemin-degrading factor [Collimonas pratensis]|uniref:Hemin-degrading HemS.ChuX domain protein n=1 Tax=Collimonas pratensis TaxID=279113 RepID=A0A127Q1R5_9BURK|nr:hemin-degrading factor [Collimonas pratensis]AMP04018.1 hemin-degrading HemS.ChuX domain protein [Collimonas pratensis]